MTDIQRALLGDHAAAERLTERGELPVCPWCRNEMRPYPHQGYFWYQCNCGARSPTVWHATENRSLKIANTRASILTPEQIEALEKMEGTV